MNLILFGAPGAGKGTQAVNIVKKYGLVHISTGDMFREAITSHTKMGDLAASYISKGNLVPDEVTVGLVKERLSKDDIKNGFILDGFPRTINQALCLENILVELNLKMDYVVDIVVNSDNLIKRLSGRRVCKGCGASYHVEFNKPKQENVCDSCNGELYIRKDDNLESVTTRLETYSNQTLPLEKFYKERNMLLEINGEQDIDDVFAEIVNKLEVL